MVLPLSFLLVTAFQIRTGLRRLLGFQDQSKLKTRRVLPFVTQERMSPNPLTLFMFQACGVDFEVKAFCAENQDEKIHKR